MTEENKVIESGVENSANGVAGGEQVDNGGVAEDKLQELIKRNEQLMNELKSRDKALNDKSELLKKYEQEQEAERLAKLSTEEKLKELEQKIKQDEEERNLINAATANGLNAQQARELVQKVKTGDYSTFASMMSTMLNEVKTKTSQQVEEQVKSSITTSTAPAIKDENEDPALIAFRKGMGRA